MSDTPDTRNHELTIELRDVVRGYRVGGQSVRALDEISLRLTGGQFVSVVGPSGAGKSTLLHLLGALDSPDSGSITFDGEEIDSLTDEQQSEFRHHRVGFIFQFFNLLPTLSAWENVAVPKLLDGVRLGKVKPDAVRLLDRVGLGNRTEHRPSELSGGQMQRVAVARALVMDPKMPKTATRYIADTAITAIEAIVRRRCTASSRRLNRRSRLAAAAIVAPGLTPAPPISRRNRAVRPAV